MNEIVIKPVSGYAYLGGSLLVILATGYAGVTVHPAFFILNLLAWLLLAGVFVVNPNEAKILVLFGKYVGSVKESGLYWANPLYSKSRISLKARNLDGDKIEGERPIGQPHRHRGGTGLEGR
jgi:hypothetical protein